LHAAAAEQYIAGNEQRVGTLARKGGKGSINLAARAGVENMDLQPDGAGSFMHVPQRGFSGSIRRIVEHCNTNSLGHQFM
jgi:hypothetical protein